MAKNNKAKRIIIIGISCAIAIALGVTYGLLSGNMGLGLFFGIAIAMRVGFAVNKTSKREYRDQNHKKRWY